MASTGQIITDLRAHAAMLDGRHHQGTMLHSTCRSLLRAACEIERLQTELFYLREALEISS